MMQISTAPVDLSRVHTVIYHMPDGKPFSIPVSGLEEFLEFGPGKICDTSEIDGVLHFFPRGNA